MFLLNKRSVMKCRWMGMINYPGERKISWENLQKNAYCTSWWRRSSVIFFGRAVLVLMNDFTQKTRHCHAAIAYAKMWSVYVLLSFYTQILCETAQQHISQGERIPGWMLSQTQVWTVDKNSYNFFNCATCTGQYFACDFADRGNCGTLKMAQNNQ